jgi:hypothetical protein
MVAVVDIKERGQSCEWSCAIVNSLAGPSR